MSEPEESASGETIGPYQVIGWLGRGGMGEVLLARDPRLGRRVAIKRIRAGGDAESRRRFQREARLAAALSHPSIVPIFDLVVLGEHEHLVMELVEGPSLAIWLEEPRSLGQKLLVAEQIAAGLAHAHRQGIIHRDLKSENVLLSDEDHAKIADFGIARRDTGLVEAGADTGEVHTREGVLLGTYRSMAPEQARGRAADARSDLFSFGVLLFEMFTGESPFFAGTPFETLSRITGQPHPDLALLVPDLPPGLVRLIDQLLEKDPGLRPQNAQEVAQRLAALRRELADRDDATIAEGRRAPALPSPAATRLARPARRRPRGWWALAALPLAGFAAWLAWPQSSEPLYAAVLAPRWAGAAAAGENHQQLLFTVRSAAQRRLSALAGISPKSSDEVDQVAGGDGAPSLPQVAAAIGADELVVPTLSCAGGDCGLRLERWRAKDQAVVAVAEADLPADDPPFASRAVESATRTLFPERRPRGGRDQEPLSDQALTRLLAIRHQLASGPDSGRLDGFIAELRALRGQNPAFYELAVLEVELLRRRYAETHDEALREPARAAMAAALAAAPDAPDVLLRAAWLAIVDERPQDAEGFLERAEKAAPGDLRVADQKALLLERTGRLEESLALRRAALARRPSWTRSYNLAFVLFRLSQWNEARKLLDDLLAQSPKHGRALSLRARIDMAAGDPRDAVARYQDLLSRGESLIDRSNLATAYLLLGDGASAARESERVLAAAPHHSYYVLALADARALEGKADEAVTLYRRVLELEQADDPQSLTVRAQAHARLGQNDEAVALLQQALRKAPGFDGQLAFESALIYTLVGDRASAKVNIREAVKQGWGGWLRLPIFAVWTGDPEIGPLLKLAGQKNGGPGEDPGR